MQFHFIGAGVLRVVGIVIVGVIIGVVIIFIIVGVFLLLLLLLIIIIIIIVFVSVAFEWCRRGLGHPVSGSLPPSPVSISS